VIGELVAEKWRGFLGEKKNGIGWLPKSKCRKVRFTHEGKKGKGTPMPFTVYLKGKGLCVRLGKKKIRPASVHAALRKVKHDAKRGERSRSEADKEKDLSQHNGEGGGHPSKEERGRTIPQADEGGSRHPLKKKRYDLEAKPA